MSRRNPYLLLIPALCIGAIIGAFAEKHAADRWYAAHPSLSTWDCDANLTSPGRITCSRPMSDSEWKVQP